MAFRSKLFLILLVTVGVTCGVLFWLNQRSAGKMSFRLMQEKVLAIAVSAAPLVDAEVHESLVSVKQNNSDDYREIRDALREVRDANQFGELKVTYIYTIRPTGKSDEFIYVVDAEEEGDDKSMIGDEVEYADGAEIPEVNQAHVDSTFATDSFGRWLTAYAPIRNANGDPVALLGVDVEADSVIAEWYGILRRGLLGLLVSLGFAAVVAHFLSRLVSAPLIELEAHVQKVSGGDFSARVEMGTDDEFGRLGSALNSMAAGLQEREALKGALVRYVSSQAVDSVIESDLETESQRRVTVLTASLIGTKGITRSVSPDRIYSLLNQWFSTTIDIVLGHRGTIEQSEGEAVSALFGAPLRDSDQERNAVEAALAMARGMKKLKETWQIEESLPLSLKVAIHTGTITISRFEAGHQQLDSESLSAIEKTAGTILEFGGVEQDGIFITEATAANLRGTIPLGEAQTFRGVNIMSVDMPI